MCIKQPTKENFAAAELSQPSRAANAGLSRSTWMQEHDEGLASTRASEVARLPWLLLGELPDLRTAVVNA